MIVPPMPCRCSAGILSSFSTCFAISPITYDSVNFFDPITIGCAKTEAEKIRKAGTQEIEKKSESQEITAGRSLKYSFLDVWCTDVAGFFLFPFPVFLIRLVKFCVFVLLFWI